ncbi:MAG: hypothetical protein GY799_12210 [Desulfobulbaceae bacterium]|nr:hypothetical protein [Desulfobulbaceae bacterium]
MTLEEVIKEIKEQKGQATDIIIYMSPNIIDLVWNRGPFWAGMGHKEINLMYGPHKIYPRLGPDDTIRVARAYNYTCVRNTEQRYSIANT